MTLFDLCDSSFVRRNVKRKKSAINVRDGVGGEGGGGGGNENDSKMKILGSSSLSNISASAAATAIAAAAAKDSLAKRNKIVETAKRAAGTPQVEFVNGKIVVKESSLVVQDQSYADGEYEEVAEGSHATATYFSFLKRRKSAAWGLEETRLFYAALRQCGTEFSLMQTLFPGRTRKQLKKKYMRYVC